MRQPHRVRDFAVSSNRISTGLTALDRLLGGLGIFEGGSVLVSGPAGSGKTTLGAHFAHAVCRREERCVYLALDEAPSQLLRNMRSVGIDLSEHLASGRLDLPPIGEWAGSWSEITSAVEAAVDRTAPTAVVVDSIGFGLVLAMRQEDGSAEGLLDGLKARGITVLLTCPSLGESGEAVDPGLTSLVDTWVRLGASVSANERRRDISVVKSRGMAHSNRALIYLIGADGIALDRRKAPRLEKNEAELTDSPFGIELP